jgi:hypothetical protein
LGEFKLANGGIAVRYILKLKGMQSFSIGGVYHGEQFNNQLKLGFQTVTGTQTVSPNQFFGCSVDLERIKHGQFLLKSKSTH